MWFFNDALITLVSQRLYLACTESGQPLLHPFGDGDLVRGLIGPTVQLPEDGSHLPPGFLLRIGVDASADGLTGTRIYSGDNAGLPFPVGPLPDRPRSLGRFCFAHCNYLQFLL